MPPPHLTPASLPKRGSLWRQKALNWQGGSNVTVTDPDAKRIARQWNREIEAELQREVEDRQAGQPWRAVVWAMLWVFWLLVLLGVVAQLKTLH
jgi:hypothetical protein